MAEAGSTLAKARQQPGLALIATAGPTANVEMHRWAAQQAEADIAALEGVGHWWPAQDPARPWKP
jgi:hypothetical protein